MKVAVTGARLFLGLIFVVFGLNEWAELFSLGAPGAHPFIEMISDAGFFHVVKGLQVLGGLMLLANFYVPVALVVLAPISTNILMYAIFLDPSFIVVDIILFVLTVFLIWAYWSYFKSIFTYKAQPRRH